MLKETLKYNNISHPALLSEGVVRVGKWIPELSVNVNCLARIKSSNYHFTVDAEGNFFLIQVSPIVLITSTPNRVYNAFSFQQVLRGAVLHRLIFTSASLLFVWCSDFIEQNRILSHFWSWKYMYTFLLCLADDYMKTHAICMYLCIDVSMVFGNMERCILWIVDMLYMVLINFFLLIFWWTIHEMLKCYLYA